MPDVAGQMTWYNVVVGVIVVVMYEMVTELEYTVLVPIVAIGLEQGTMVAGRC